MPDGESCDYVKLYRNVQEAGAKGVILVSDEDNAAYGAPAYLLRTLPGHKDITINGVEIPRSSSIGRLVLDEKREDVYVSLTEPGNLLKNIE